MAGRDILRKVGFGLFGIIALPFVGLAYLIIGLIAIPVVAVALVGWSISEFGEGAFNVCRRLLTNLKGDA